MVDALVSGASVNCDVWVRLSSRAQQMRSIEVLTLIGLVSVYYYSCFPLEVQEIIIGMMIWQHEKSMILFCGQDALLTSWHASDTLYVTVIDMDSELPESSTTVTEWRPESGRTRNWWIKRVVPMKLLSRCQYTVASWLVWARFRTREPGEPSNCFGRVMTLPFSG